MEKTMEYAKKDFTGLCFTNLVDFDMKYGHRRDVEGYTNALNEFSLSLQNFIDKMGDDDILMITADHGCDPATPSTDHSREYVPLLVYGKTVKPVNLGTKPAYACIAKTVCDIFGVKNDLFGESFKNEIL